MCVVVINVDVGHQSRGCAMRRCARAQKLQQAKSAPPRGKFCDKAAKHKEGKKQRNASHLLELLDGTLVDSTALVDQVTYYIREPIVCRGEVEVGECAYQWWWTFRNRRGR
jgi:hypothetical protein